MPDSNSFPALTLGGCILNSCRTLDTPQHRNHKPQAGGWLCISSAGTWTSLIQQGSMPAAGVRKWTATTSDTSVCPGGWASPRAVDTFSSLSARPGAPCALTRILLTSTAHHSLALTQPGAAQLQHQHLVEGLTPLGSTAQQTERLLLPLRGQQLWLSNTSRPNPPTASHFVGSDTGMPQGTPVPWGVRLHTRFSQECATRTKTVLPDLS